MLPEESEVQLLSLLVSLVLVALGVFLLNYAPKAGGAAPSGTASISGSVTKNTVTEADIASLDTDGE